MLRLALVRLVDDDRVVAPQRPVAADLGQQQAVGDQPDQRARARAVAEAHGVADRLSELHAELVRDPLGDRARREPARLRVGDHAVGSAPELEADLRQLRRLARARSLPRRRRPGVADRGEQVVLALGDGNCGG
jgi:hypothetical protein